MGVPVVTKTALPDAGYLVLPKRWSLAVLYSFIVLTLTAATGAATVYHRLGQLDATDARVDRVMLDRRAANEKRFEELSRDRDRLIRVEEKLSAQGELLKRIEGKLDRL